MYKQYIGLIPLSRTHTDCNLALCAIVPVSNSLKLCGNTELSVQVFAPKRFMK